MGTSDGHRTPLPAPLADKTVAILGAGKVGCAVGSQLRAAGVPVVAVTAKTPASAENAARITGGRALDDNVAAAALADIVLITVNDDNVAAVCREIADAGALRPSQLVIHMSGALRLAVLAPAAAVGALIACAHPLQSFATYESAARDIAGSVFGVTAEPDARAEVEALVDVLGGRSVEVADDKKTIYHAAAVMASNYLVAVEDAAIGLLVEAGFDEAGATEALAPLVRVSVDNISRLGTTAALTGPIVRGDVETVRGHLAALAELGDDRVRLYQALGRQTLEISLRRGTLDPATAAQLRELLGGC